MIHNGATYHTLHPQSIKNRPSTPRHQGLKSRSHYTLTENQPLEVVFRPLKTRICTKVHNALTRANDTFPHVPKHPKIPRLIMRIKNRRKPKKMPQLPPKTPRQGQEITQLTPKTPEKHHKINSYRLILSRHCSPTTQNTKTH